MLLKFVVPILMFSSLFSFAAEAVDFATAFREASRARGDLGPFEFPVGPNEFVTDQFGYRSSPHRLTSPDRTHRASETILRNYNGTVAEFRAATGMSGFYSNLSADQAQNYRVVMVKNERGYYIPQVLSQLRGEWNPEWPSQNATYVSSNASDVIWRETGNGNAQAVSCPRSISEERIDSGNSCQVPQPTVRTCGYDSYLEGSNTSIQAMGTSNFNCSASQNLTNEYQCMACNLYFESRAEGSVGMRAVAEVTLTSQARNVRRGTANSSPICQAVYRPGRFSWTAHDAIVDSSKVPDQRAWQEALFLATQYVGQSGSSNPVVNDPKLHCYRYYLSTVEQYYDERRDFPSWGQQFYDGTINRSNNFRPLCIGNHIFLRDPDENCPQADVGRTRENDVTDREFRGWFFRDCMAMNEQPPAPPSPPTPNSEICSHNTLDEAIAAQRAAGVDTTPPGVHSDPTTTDANR